MVRCELPLRTHWRGRFGLPRQHRYPPSLRCDGHGARCLLPLSLVRFIDPARPFPPQGPSGWFPRFTGTTGALRLPASFPQHSRWLVVRYHLPPFSSHSVWGRSSSGGEVRASQVPGGPSGRVPCSPTPVGPPRSATSALRCCLPPLLRRRLPRVSFRGSITRPTTLVVYASPAGLPQSCARLASGWRPASTGWGLNPQGPMVGFPQTSTSSLPPHPGFAWRTKGPLFVLEP